MGRWRTMGWLIPLAVLLVHGRSLTIGFMGDDYDLLTAVSQPSFDPWMTFPAGTGTYFRPMLLWLLYVEQQVVGTTAVWYHLVTLLLHVVNGWLVFRLCQRLAGEPGLSLLLALLFVVHPVGLTAVANLNASVDSLMTLFYLSSLWSFIRFTDSGQPQWLWVTGLSLVGSLLSKEMGVTLVLVLWWWWRYEGRTDKSVGWLALYLYLLVTGLFAGYVYGRFYLPLATAPSFNWGYAVATFVGFPLLLLLPNRQTMWLQLYEAHPWLLSLGATMLVLAGLALLVWGWQRKYSRDGWLALGWLIITLLPLAVSGINSRRVYLPLVIFCLGLALVLKRRPGRWHYRALVGGTAVYALLACLQGQVWLANWQTLQTACRSLPPLAPETELIFLTVPYAANDVPVFTNDLNKTLYFCQTQQFGAYDRVGVTGNLIVENGRFAADMVTLTRSQPGKLNFAIEQANAYFDFPREAKVGQVYASAVVQIEVMAVGENGRVTAFTAAFSQPTSLENSQLFYFTGAEFQAVSVGS